MAKRLPDSTDHMPIFPQRPSRFSTEGDERCTKQCAPLSSEMKVYHDGSHPGRARDLVPPKSNERRNRSNFIANLSSPTTQPSVRDEDRKNSGGSSYRARRTNHRPRSCKSPTSTGEVPAFAVKFWYNCLSRRSSMIPGHSRLAPHGLPLDNPIHDNHWGRIPIY